MFHPDHAVAVRHPRCIKRCGEPDKPYEISWWYPAWAGDRFDTRRRRLFTTERGAMAFVLKHRISPDNVPLALRRAIKLHKKG